MIPDVTRTGEVEIKENGMSINFSVDNRNHTVSVKYYEDAWKDFPDMSKLRLGRLLSSVWISVIPSETKIYTHRINDTDLELLKFLTYQSQNYFRKRAGLTRVTGEPTMKVTLDEKDFFTSSFHGDMDIFFSGGKGSVATFIYAKNAGYEPELNICSGGTTMGIPEHSAEKLGEDFNKVWNNHDVVISEIEKVHEVPLFEGVGMFGVFLESIPVMENELQIFGHRRSTTRYGVVGGQFILTGEWTKSMISTQVMSEWASGNGLNLRVGSIIRERMITDIVNDVFEEGVWDAVHSCEHVGKEEYTPCSRCKKCFENFYLLDYVDEERGYSAKELRKHSMVDDQVLESFDVDTVSYMRNPPLLSDNPSAYFDRMKANPTLFLKKPEFALLYEGYDDYVSISSEEATFSNYYDLENIWRELKDEYKFKCENDVTDNNSLLNF